MPREVNIGALIERYGLDAIKLGWLPNDFALTLRASQALHLYRDAKLFQVDPTHLSDAAIENIAPVRAWMKAHLKEIERWLKPLKKKLPQRITRRKNKNGRR